MKNTQMKQVVLLNEYINHIDNLIKELQRLLTRMESNIFIINM